MKENDSFFLNRVPNTVDRFLEEERFSKVELPSFCTPDDTRYGSNEKTAKKVTEEETGSSKIAEGQILD